MICRYYVVGTSVKHSFDTFGKDGPQNISSLRRYVKWHHPTWNMQIGDIVVLQEDNMVPTKWPLAKVVQVHEGCDKLVRVVSIKTATGIYKRPITKIALLLPNSESP